MIIVNIHEVLEFYTLTVYIVCPEIQASIQTPNLKTLIMSVLLGGVLYFLNVILSKFEEGKAISRTLSVIYFLSCILKSSKT